MLLKEVNKDDEFVECSTNIVDDNSKDDFWNEL